MKNWLKISARKPSYWGGCGRCGNPTHVPVKMNPQEERSISQQQRATTIVEHHEINLSTIVPSTYDHRVWKTGLPVRSAVLKPHAGRLVVGWVTTSESLLLYVFMPLFLFYHAAKWNVAFLYAPNSCLVVMRRCIPELSNPHQPSVPFAPVPFDPLRINLSTAHYVYP